jgi:hypothetical protein
VFEQNPEVQELPLRQMAEHRGWTVTKVYSDSMSGSKSDRPGLNALMRDARRGPFDVVVVWRFDRFARSIEQLVLALAEFRPSESISYPPRKPWTPRRQCARPCSPSSAPWPSWSATSFASGWSPGQDYENHFRGQFCHSFARDTFSAVPQEAKRLIWIVRKSVRVSFCEFPLF